MAFGFRLFTFAGLGLSSPFGRVTHTIFIIHPLETDMKETESRAVEWSSSLEECEVANKKFFGGSGMCHRFPDGIFNGINDDWRARRRDYSRPQDPPSE